MGQLEQDPGRSFADSPAGTSLVLNFDDGWFFAVGGEYQVNPGWTVRLGFAYEIAPTTDEHRSMRLPDSDRIWAEHRRQLPVERPTVVRRRLFAYFRRGCAGRRNDGTLPLCGHRRRRRRHRFGRTSLQVRRLEAGYRRRTSSSIGDMVGLSRACSSRPASMPSITPMAIL